MSRHSSPAEEASSSESRKAPTNEEETPSQPFRYADLPTEIRLRILTFTDLVLPRQDELTLENHYGGTSLCWGYSRHGILVHGKRSKPNRIPSILGLSRMSKLLNNDVLDVWFSQNRLVLSRDWDDNLEFLSSLPGHAIRSVRSLYLDVITQQVEGYYYNDGPLFGNADRSSWGRLMSFIAANFNLPWLNITLSTNKIHVADCDEFAPLEGISAKTVLETHAKMVKAMKGLCGVKYFAVSFAQPEWHMREAAEQYIMGPNHKPQPICHDETHTGVSKAHAIVSTN